MEEAIEESFALNLKCMKWSGFDPRRNSKNFWNKVYGHTAYFFAAWLFSILGALVPIQDDNLDMDSLFDTFYLLPQMLILTVKIFPFFYRTKKVEYLLKRFHEDDFLPKLPEHEAIVESCTRECKKLSAFFIYSSWLAWILWAMKPFYSDEQILPFELYLPFKISREHSMYYPIFLYISLSVLYGATSNSSIDCLISGLIYHASGQIKILKDKLANVGLRADAMASHIEGEEEREKRRNVFILRQMRENLDHYDNIISYVKELENVFTFTPFIQLSVSTIVICLNCFRMIYYIEPLSMDFFSLASYLTTIVFQIYMFCHYGNELHCETAYPQFRHYVFFSEHQDWKCDWYTFDKESKRMLVMLMERAKKPLLFKAGNLLPLSVGTFVSIMKTTYSLLAVLQNRK